MLYVTPLGFTVWSGERTGGEDYSREAINQRRAFGLKSVFAFLLRDATIILLIDPSVCKLIIVSFEKLLV